MTIKEQYRKERRLLTQRIRRARKAGYIVPDSLLPKIPKRPTAASVRRLKALDTKTVYERSIYQPATGPAVPASVEQARRRSERSRKAYQTRRQREQLRQLTEKALQQAPADRLQDLIDQLSEPDIYEPEPVEPIYDEVAEFPEMGEIIYQRVLDDIASAAGDPATERSAEFLKSALDSEIQQFGFSNVMRGISDAPDEFLDACDVALRYRSGAPQQRGAIASILTVIRGGVIPDAGELAYMDDLNDLELDL